MRSLEAIPTLVVPTLFDVLYLALHWTDAGEGEQLVCPLQNFLQRKIDMSTSLIL